VRREGHGGEVGFPAQAVARERWRPWFSEFFSAPATWSNRRSRWCDQFC